MESGEGNAKRGCGRWMEECGRGAAVEQLTARGMEYQSPQWGAIVIDVNGHTYTATYQSPRWGAIAGVATVD